MNLAAPRRSRTLNNYLAGRLRVDGRRAASLRFLIEDPNPEGVLDSGTAPAGASTAARKIP